MNYLREYLSYTEDEIRGMIKKIMVEDEMNVAMLAASLHLSPITLLDFLQEKRPARMTTVIKLHNYVKNYKEKNN